MPPFVTTLLLALGIGFGIYLLSAGVRRPSMKSAPLLNVFNFKDRKRLLQWAVVVLAGTVLALWLSGVELTYLPSSASLIWWGLVALLAGLLFSGSLPKEWEGWRKLPTLLGLMLIIAGVYTSGMGTATSRWFETNIEKCLGDENCPEENEAAKTLTAAPKVLAKGVLKAKFDHPTATIHISRGQKIFWSSNAIQKIEDHGRTVNFDLDADKFIALAKVNGQWYEYDQLSCWEKREIRAVRWIARYPGPPIGISYQIYKPVEDSSRC